MAYLRKHRDKWQSIIRVQGHPHLAKSFKSKSLYCAGYYIIKFDKGWVKSFCPKLVTLETYDYKGPFKQKLEMREALGKANAKRSY